MPYFNPFICTDSSEPIWRPPLWSRGNIVASHPAGPSSIPDRVSFLVEVFLNCKTNVRKFRPPLSLGIIWPSSKTIFIQLQMATVSDLRCSTGPSLNKIMPYTMNQFDYKNCSVYSQLMIHYGFLFVVTAIFQ